MQLSEAQIPFTDDEIKEAVLDNLRSCHSGGPLGPPVRIVPESLCLEIEQILMFGNLHARGSDRAH